MLIKVGQKEAFEKEQKWLSQKTDKLPNTSKLYQLDPTLKMDCSGSEGGLEDLPHPLS